MGNIVYDKANTKQVKFKFNIKTDADILEHLKRQTNIQGYIKTLIRADIAAHTPDEQTEEEES